MNKRRKIVVGPFVVLILLLAAILIAPMVVDKQLVKARVRSELKQTAGVEINFEHLVLDFFPHPQNMIDRVVLAIPPGVKGKAASVTVVKRDRPFDKQDAGVGEWVEAMVRLEGPGVLALNALFRWDWEVETGRELNKAFLLSP